MTGRGQSGFAGFYRSSKNEQIYLIKQDNSGVCLAEASATNDFLPFLHQDSIRCAEIGCMNDHLITIQPMVQGYQNTSIEPFDTCVYGRKRAAKTLVSYEFRHRKKIINFIENLSPIALDDLAVALYASTALGDESVHLGQFMAITQGQNSNKKVVRIVRVDFGARERFTKKRDEESDFYPTQTSQAYVRSGQFGKDYISYLLASPKLRSRFLLLWAQTDVGEIAKAQIQKLREQLANLPVEQQKKALYAFLDDINREAKSAIELDKDLPWEHQLNQFVKKFEFIVIKRSMHMKQHAKMELFDTIDNAIHLSIADKAALRFILTAYSHESVSIHLIKTIAETVKTILDTEPLDNKTKATYHSLLDYLDAAETWNNIKYNDKNDSHLNEMKCIAPESLNHGTLSILTGLSGNTTPASDLTSLDSFDDDNDIETIEEEQLMDDSLLDEDTNEENQHSILFIKK